MRSESPSQLNPREEVMEMAKRTKGWMSHVLVLLAPVAVFMVSVAGWGRP